MAITSITQRGTTEDFGLQVARGQIPYHKSNFKFGFNADVDDALETVWSKGGLYAYLSSATALYISSSSTDDTVAGTGARTVKVSGLDSNYDEVSVTVDMDGQSGVSLGTFIRVNRIEVLTAGSGGANAGNLHVGSEASPTIGVPATTYAYVTAGDNQTLMALWTVPRNYTAYVTQTDITVATTQNNKYCTVSLVARPFGGVFNVKDRFVKAESSVNQVYNFPLKFEEKTDIEFRAIGDSAGADIAISAGIDILYILNDLYKGD
jgi:hypothetical protein